MQLVSMHSVNDHSQDVVCNNLYFGDVLRRCSPEVVLVNGFFVHRRIHVVLK